MRQIHTNEKQAIKKDRTPTVIMPSPPNGISFPKKDGGLFVQARVVEEAQLSKPIALKIDMLSFLQSQEIPAILTPRNTTEKRIIPLSTLARQVDIE